MNTQSNPKQSTRSKPNIYNYADNNNNDDNDEKLLMDVDSSYHTVPNNRKQSRSTTMPAM